MLERVFSENDAAAEANRAAFDAAGVRCVNVMSSPGAGKTALLARTLAHLQRGRRGERGSSSATSRPRSTPTGWVGWAPRSAW